ncbi:MAG: 30S ribosomal protein S13 [bacterium]|nr:30S ribosomal protein S13 [bacterium]
MARIAGVELPDNQRIDYSLTLIYGVGWPRSREVLKTANVDPSLKTKDLTEEQFLSITRVVEVHTIEGDLRREIRQNIQRLKDIGTYRGVRHNRGLPVHGQRTRSNARTKRGKRKTIGAFKKEAISKQTTAGAKKS